MARHRIDRALLADAAPVEDTDVVGRRIGIDDPYASAKYLLLAGLAEVNGARAVWSTSLGSATVFGFPVELDIIEELFTSLLVQATAAMQREGCKEDAYGRSRHQGVPALVPRWPTATGSPNGCRHSVDDTVTTVAAETGTASSCRSWRPGTRPSPTRCGRFPPPRPLPAAQHHRPRRLARRPPLR